jgi:predicted transcriptional regulator
MSEVQEAEFDEIVDAMKVRDVMITHFESLPLGASIHTVDKLLSTTQKVFPVVRPDGRLVGMIPRDDIVAAIGEQKTAMTVLDIVRSPVPTIGQDDLMRACLDKMRGEGATVVGVIDGAGLLAGLVDCETIGELIVLGNFAAAGFRLAFGRRATAPARVKRQRAAGVVLTPRPETSSKRTP